MKRLIIFAILISLLLIGLGVGYYFIRKTSLAPKASEISEIQKRGKLIIGTEALYPPMEYFDENGNFAGIDIEIGKRIAKGLNVKAEFRHIPWDELFDSLLKGEVDVVISAVTILPQREEIMAFSRPYFNAGQVIVTKKEKIDQIKTVEDLREKPIGVQTQTTSEIEARKISENVISYQNYQEAKEALSKGEIEAIIIDYPAAIGMTKEDKSLVIVGKPFTQEFYGIATRKENVLLLEKINEILSEMQRNGELEEIIAKWLEE